MSRVGHKITEYLMHRRTLFSVALRLACALPLLAACTRVETPKVTPVTVRLRIASDSAALPLMQALTSAYTTEHPNVVFGMQSGDAQTVANLVFAGQVDLAAVSILPPDAPDRPKPWVADLAMDGVAIIVNSANPVNSLSMQELRDIYAGAHNSWSDFGVTGLNDMQVAVREEGDGTRATFDSLVMGGQSLTSNAVLLPTVEVAMNFVALQTNAIAYVPSGRITGTVASKVKILSINGQQPTPANLTSGAYPLSRMLNLLAPSEPQGDLRLFVAWALGHAGQRVASNLNYVPAAQVPN